MDGGQSYDSPLGAPRKVDTAGAAEEVCLGWDNIRTRGPVTNSAGMTVSPASEKV